MNQSSETSTVRESLGRNRLNGSNEDYRKRKIEELSKLLQSHRFCNWFLCGIAVILGIVSFKIKLIQFRACVILSSAFTLFISFLGCGNYFFYEWLGQYLYGLILFLHFLASLVSGIIELIGISNYIGCLKGSQCEEFYSHSFSWPYALSFFCTVLILILTVTLAVHYLNFLSVLSLLQDTRMRVGGERSEGSRSMNYTYSNLLPENLPLEETDAENRRVISSFEIET